MAARTQTQRFVYDPLFKAQQVKSGQQAAKLATRIETGLAHPDAPADWASDADDALALLAEKWAIEPGASYGPKETPTPARTNGRTNGTGPATGTRKPPRERSRARRAPHRRSAWAPRGGPLEATGVPSSVRDTTASVLEFIGATIGLSILYLLLTGKGPRGVEVGAGKVVDALQRIVRPIDPLRSAASQKKQAAAKSTGKGKSTSSSSTSSGHASALDTAQAIFAPNIAGIPLTPLAQALEAEQTVQDAVGSLLP